MSLAIQEGMDGPNPSSTALSRGRAVQLWLLWVLANTIAMAIGGATVILPWTLGMPLFGLLAGVGQWLVLRRWLPIRPSWILVTAVGNVVGWIAALGAVLVTYFPLTTIEILWLPRIIPPMLSFTIGGATGGWVLGQTQREDLKRYIRSTGLWTAASTMAGALVAIPGGLLLAAVLVSISGPTFLFKGESRSVFRLIIEGTVYFGEFGAILGLIYGAITGLALVALVAGRLPWPASPVARYLSLASLALSHYRAWLSSRLERHLPRVPGSLAGHRARLGSWLVRHRIWIMLLLTLALSVLLYGQIVAGKKRTPVTIHLIPTRPIPSPPGRYGTPAWLSSGWLVFNYSPEAHTNLGPAPLTRMSPNGSKWQLLPLVMEERSCRDEGGPRSFQDGGFVFSAVCDDPMPARPYETNTRLFL